MFFKRRNEDRKTTSGSKPESTLFDKFADSEANLEKDTYNQVKDLIEKAAIDSSIAALRKWMSQNHPDWWLEGHPSEFLFGMTGRGHRKEDLAGIILSEIEALRLPGRSSPSLEEIERALAPEWQGSNSDDR